MKRLFTLPGACLVALVLLPLLPGCKKKDDVKLVPVQGTVTMKGGEKVTSGHVTFWPTAGKDAKAGNSTGEIKDGTYKLTTGGREGAPEGTYKVTISTSTVPTGGTSLPVAPFNTMYGRQDTTPITITVPAAADMYNLQLEK